MVTVALGVAVIALQGYVALYLVYLWVPALAAALAPRSGPDAVALPPGPRDPFVILISAHNEATVIGALLDSLSRQDYPAERQQVHVVANNCTDATATVVRGSGRATCHERDGGDLATKGAALSWLWERLCDRVPADARVLVLDADNLVAPDFLSELDRAFSRGHRVVQAVRRAKNANDSWSSQLDAISEALWNRLDQAGRMRLGLSATIAGSGMAFARDVFGWLIETGTPGLLEDIEWQARLMLAGIRVGYAPRARVYDEKTGRARQLGRQRKRWVAGVAVAGRRYGGRLLVAGIRQRSVQQLMAAFSVTKPPRSLLLAAMALLAAAGWALPGAPALLPWPLWVGALVSFGAYLLLGMWLDHAPARAYLALLRAPLFAGLIVAASVAGVLGASRQRWTPTTHGQGVAVDQPWTEGQA